MREKNVLVPVTALCVLKEKAPQRAGRKGYPQVEEDGPGNVSRREAHRHHRGAHEGRELRGKEPRHGAVEQHLQDRVNRDKASAPLRVTAGKTVPDNNHRDAGRNADEDEAGHVVWLIA